MLRAVPSRSFNVHVGLLLVGVVGGCTCEVDTYRVLSQSSVEEAVASALGQKVGERPDAVECPADLKVRPGESMRCFLVSDGVRAGVTVTSKDRDGNLGFEVDDRAAAVVGASLAQALPALVEPSTGLRVTHVQCAGDLPAEVGKTIRCTYRSGDGPGAMKVTVTSVDGMKVRYDAKLETSETSPPSP